MCVWRAYTFFLLPQLPFCQTLFLEYQSPNVGEIVEQRCHLDRGGGEDAKLETNTPLERDQPASAQQSKRTAGD